MLKYLEEKRATLEARKAVKSDVYADIDEHIEEYKNSLYKERNEAIDNQNMVIDAQVAILNEVIEETKNAVENGVEEEQAIETEL